MKIYAKYNPIESELSRNKAKQKDNITNDLYTIDDTFFPTHSDTHFLSKYVEYLTPFKIKLSRNKEKQTDNIQTTLWNYMQIHLFSHPLLLPFSIQICWKLNPISNKIVQKQSKTERQYPNDSISIFIFHFN